MPILAKARHERFAQELAKGYYVYFLIDPRDGQIFYIGKGKGKRVSSHVRAVKKGKLDNAPKCLRIAEILDAGKDVVEHIHAADLSEHDAYDLERALILQHRDHGLTNIASGRISEMEAARAQARWMKRCILPYELWVLTAPSGALEYARQAFGDLKSFYGRFVAEVDAMIENPLCDLNLIKAQSSGPRR